MRARRLDFKSRASEGKAQQLRFTLGGDGYYRIFGSAGTFQREPWLIFSLLHRRDRCRMCLPSYSHARRLRTRGPRARALALTWPLGGDASGLLVAAQGTTITSALTLGRLLLLWRSRAAWGVHMQSAWCWRPARQRPERGGQHASGRRSMDGAVLLASSLLARSSLAPGGMLSRRSPAFSLRGHPLHTGCARSSLACSRLARRLPAHWSFASRGAYRSTVMAHH